jgi:hypothetical protein
MIEWNKTEEWKNWKLSDFVEWHKGLAAHFGDQKTPNGKFFKKDSIWVTYWIASEGSIHPKLNLLIHAPSQFKKETDYLKKTAPDIYNNIGFKDAVEFGKYNPVDKAVMIAKGGFDIVEGVASAVSSAGKIIKVALPLALAAALVIGGIWAYKKYS